MRRILSFLTLFVLCQGTTLTWAAVDANSLNYSEESGSEINGTMGGSSYPESGYGVYQYKRQGRDYVPPGATSGHVQYMTPPVASIGLGHQPQTAGAYAAPAPAYAAPAGAYAAPVQSSYGTPSQPIMMQGAYGVPSHYAIPPIVMGSSGGYGDGGYGGEDFGGGGSDYKELIGLLGLKGLKGLKGVKAVKALKGLGLLALSPILLPLLPFLPIILPIILFLPLLIPLLLLLLIPIPVVTVPGGRRKKRSTQGPRSIFEDTLNSLVTNLPPSINNVPPAHLNECLDTFVCQTGELVHRTVPSLVRPAAWLLTSLWPAEMHSKVAIFEKADKCRERFKCRVKKLEHLFHHVVYRESVKLKNKIEQKVGEKGPVGWGEIIKILFE